MLAAIQQKPLYGFGQDNFIIIHFVHPAERYKVVLPTGFRIAFRKLDALTIQMGPPHRRVFRSWRQPERDP